MCVCDGVFSDICRFVQGRISTGLNMVTVLVFPLLSLSLSPPPSPPPPSSSFTSFSVLLLFLQTKV